MHTLNLALSIMKLTVPNLIHQWCLNISREADSINNSNVNCPNYPTDFIELS